MADALLIIDMQTGLYAGPEHPFERERVLQTINQLIGRARHAGAPSPATQARRAPRLLRAARIGRCGMSWMSMKRVTSSSIKPGPVVSSAPIWRSDCARCSSMSW